MRKLTGRIVVVTLFVATLACPGHAQPPPGGGGDKAEQAPYPDVRTYPRWEWFWGFSYLHSSLGSQTLVVPTSTNYYGIRTALKLNPHKNIGVLLDVGGGWGRTLSPSKLKPDTGQLLFGPEFTFHRRTFSVFSHPLVGVNTTSLSLMTSDGSVGEVVSRRHLALDFGGGLDINWKRSLAIRLLQADYIPVRSDGKWQSSFVVSSGIVLRFCSFFGPFFDKCATK
jgi:hypothetical protein